MKKRAVYLVLLVLFCALSSYLFPVNTEALTYGEIEARTVCPLYELAEALNNGNLQNVGCYGSYQEAKNVMNVTNNDNLVILQRDGGMTVIVDAKYAIASLNKNNISSNTNILNSGSSNDNTVYTYINGNPSYGAGDAAYLGVNPENYRIKIRIGGITGFVRKIEDSARAYHIIPLAWVKSTTKYVVTDTITHYTTANIYGDSYSNQITYGPKPSMLEPGSYYSYDGIYFYRDIKTMLIDYMNGNFQQAVNVNKPYYNYYLYLPHHSKTNYSGTDIDEYLANLFNKLGYDYSMLYGTGYAFYQAEKLYGANALLMLSVARNESANGKSLISTDKYNVFGHSAYDSSPGASASGYATVRAGIEAHAYKYLTYGYTFASDYRFYGGHLGNKAMGANVKYASDPYWGEKAAANYYSFDSTNGLQDYNYYQVAVKSKDGVIYPSSIPSLATNYRISTINATSKEPYYNYGRNGSPVLILEEVQGQEVEGSTLWYKIMSDVNIDSNHNYINYNSSNPPLYNWQNNYVYVPAAYFTKINENPIKNPNAVTEYVTSKYEYETYMSGGVLTPKIGRIKNNNTKLYHDASLLSLSGRSWNQNQLVVVYEKAYDENANTKSYLISANYRNGYNEWVNQEDIDFVTMSYGRLDMLNNRVGYGANIRRSPGGAAFSMLHEGTYAAVLENKVVNGTPWTRIAFDGGEGWLVTTDSDQNFIMTTITNYPPEIEANNIDISVGNPFNPLLYARAKDLENGDITSRIKVIANNVDINKIGTYSVTYEVSDIDLVSVTKTISVRVVEPKLRPGLFDYKSFKQVNLDTFEVAGFLGVVGMDNSQSNNIKHSFILYNTLTKQEYTYSLAQWKTGYPYEISNIDDDKPYNYNGGWFKGNIDLTSVPEGDYIAYIEVVNGLYKSRELYQNLVYGEMTRKAEGLNNRGYLFQMNYYTKSRPLDISIRNKGLIANDIPPTTDKMFNLFETIKFMNNKLQIRGTSHNVGINYGDKQLVKREIILENVETFARYSSEVGSINNGDYLVDLKVPDGKDKTRAWFDGGIDIGTLEKGVYSILIKTTVDGFSDYGELKDLSYRNFTDKVVINSKSYSFRRTDSLRFRMELVVE
ncbi:MAG: glucosaminidase domain-containing protein [Bacilli bacterium]